jgi:hypothetical protein
MMDWELSAFGGDQAERRSVSRAAADGQPFKRRALRWLGGALGELPLRASLSLGLQLRHP